MDFTTGEPSEEALSQFVQSLVQFLVNEQDPHPQPFPQTVGEGS